MIRHAASLATARVAIAVTLLVAAPAGAQTLGLLQNDPGSFPGYTLFNSLASRTTYLVDHDGLFVQSWSSDWVVGNSAYLLDSGHLLRTADPGGPSPFTAGGDAGAVEEYDWTGELLWQFLYSDDQVRAHHDVAPLPNGNVLVLAWELRDAAACIQAGRDPSTLPGNALWPEHIVEVQPTPPSGGIIVWEWHVWDHLIQDFDPTKDNFGVVADHPELIDINYFDGAQADWLHANAIDYNPELDQILVSSPFWSEFWIIDHSTTTAEAASHSGGLRGRGGDLLYRWGNPQTYGRGNADDRQLYGQHDVQWIEPGLPGAGNILLFNNGRDRPGDLFSTIDELTTTVDAGGDYPEPPAGQPHGPASATTVYIADPPTDFYASFVSGAQRQPNGNTLICDGPMGRFFEMTPANEQVWLYVNPVGPAGPLQQGSNPSGNTTFRAERYAPDFPGFDGRDLTPGAPIETGVIAVADPRAQAPGRIHLAGNYPNPFHPSTAIAFELPAAAAVELAVFDVAGRRVDTLVRRRLAAGPHRYTWDARGLASGSYRYVLSVDGHRETGAMLLVK